MAASGRLTAGALVAGMLAAAPALGQESGGLRPAKGLVTLDYQVVKVPGDKPIDLTGLHLHQEVAEGLYVGGGVYAPLVRGAYGGFTAWDLGGQLRHPLGPRVFATAGLSAGGGGGGRNVEQSKVLTGTGRFFTARLGLGYDFGAFTVGAGISHIKFTRSAIDGTQANVFVEIPYQGLAGPFADHGRDLSADESRRAAEASGESMLTVVLDNLRQIDPEGTNKSTINLADLQYAHFVGRDTYWYAGVGVGYRGLPLYNHVIGGLGQRLRLTPRISVHAQLGIGSGGYAPEVLGTDAGLLVYPRVSAEFAVTRDLGVSVSAGYLTAPKGSSRNQTFGIALTRHFRSGEPGVDARPTMQAFRLAASLQTESSLRWRDIPRDRLQSIAIQGDMILDDRWYLPVQAAVATSAYLGYPGYGELLAGVGVQGRFGDGGKLQPFAQLMAGTNVHGATVKASVGLRYDLNERLGVRADVGRVAARGSSGGRFSANSLAVGLDYRFSLPIW